MSPLTQIRRTVPATDPLDRETELKLALAWRDHEDEDAASRLVKAHMRYVVATAVKYRRYGVPLDELISEGNFGLVHALRKFEPERGFRFVTYAAYWIRAYILNYIIRSWSLVGSGSGVLRSKMFFRLRRERVKLANLLGDREEAEAALADKLGTSREQLTNMLRRLEARDVSLDTKVFDDGSATLLDTLVSKAEGQDEHLYVEETRTEVADWVKAAMENLDRRERYIVEQRLMADHEDKLSLAEIGRTLGVSRERARQLEARAKNKLKSQLLLKASGATLDVLREDYADQRSAA
jgi:RNA polymerase sigma-32 factor